MRTDITKKLLIWKPIGNQKTRKSIQFERLDCVSILTKEFYKAKRYPFGEDTFLDVKIEKDNSNSVFYLALLLFLLKKKILKSIDYVKENRLSNTCMIGSHLSENKKSDCFLAYKDIHQNKERYTLDNINFDMILFKKSNFAMCETIVSNELFEFVMGRKKKESMGYIESMCFCNNLSKIFNLKPYYKASIFLKDWVAIYKKYEDVEQFDEKYADIHYDLKDKNNYVLGGNGFRLPTEEEKKLFDFSVDAPKTSNERWGEPSETWEILEEITPQYESLSMQTTYHMSISNGRNIESDRIESDSAQYDNQLRIARTITPSPKT